jgi:hypothetical protein
MSLKYGIVFTVLLLVFYSCSNPNQFPQKISENVTTDQIVLNKSFFPDGFTVFNDSVAKSNFEKELEKLFQEKKKFDGRDSTFNLTVLENLWENMQPNRNNFNFENVKQWIDITGFLLELTGNTKYAGELEEIVYQSPSFLTGPEYAEIEKEITPLVFTKDVDHIYVNLFANATLKYEHSLYGAVEITQETSYPESGKIQIKFKMEKKRYIELFIRIPEWAEGATVTEWRVKYVTIPGEYCQIMRKWGDGDIVEINFPIENMPKK